MASLAVLPCQRVLRTPNLQHNRQFSVSDNLKRFNNSDLVSVLVFLVTGLLQIFSSRIAKSYSCHYPYKQSVLIRLTVYVSPSGLIIMSPAGLSGSIRYLMSTGGRPNLHALIPSILLPSRYTTAQLHEPVAMKQRRSRTCT